MFDKLWPVLQHGLLLLIPAFAAVLLPWASSELVPALGTIDPRYAALASAFITLAALIVTPLTKQYGVVGKNSSPNDRGSDPNA